MIPSDPERGQGRRRSHAQGHFQQYGGDTYPGAISQHQDPYLEHDAHLSAISRDQSGDAFSRSAGGGLSRLGPPPPHQWVSRSLRYVLRTTRESCRLNGNADVPF